MVGLNILKCNGTERLGCPAMFEGPWRSYSAETRREARKAGWVVGLPNRIRNRPRLDYCPDCAARRGLTTPARGSS